MLAAVPILSETRDVVTTLTIDLTPRHNRPLENVDNHPCGGKNTLTAPRESSPQRPECDGR